MFTSARMQLPTWFLQVQTPPRSSGCRSENHVHAGNAYIQERPDNTSDQVYTLEHKTLPSVCESTPWPGMGKMSGNLFEDRNWLLHQTIWTMPMKTKLKMNIRL